MTEEPGVPLLVPETAGVSRADEYHGNTNDLIALTAAVSGLTVCGYLATNGLVCCLPLVLGIAGLAAAGSAADPARARTMSLIGIGSILVLFLLLVCCIVLYVGFIALAALGSARTY
jgi:hypothetical protein